MMLGSDTPSDKIVPLHKTRPGQRTNPLRLVEGYWSALREDGALPKRSQVHPRGLADVLEHVFVLERIASGNARFRIAGSQLTQLAGIEVRGMPISAFFRTSARSDLAAALEACLDRPAIVEAELTAHSLQRGPSIEGQLILLPMRCELGHVNRILGAVKMSAALKSDAYRLELGERVVKPVYGAFPVAKPRHSQAAEPAVRFDGVPKLELVHSADQD